MTKVLLIGLDGVPLSLIKNWCDQGHLPTLNGLMTNGAVGNLRSTVPHTSAPAWSAFMTGKNPGKTGVFDFLYRKPGSYTFYPNNSHTRTGKALWEILSEVGKTSAVANVPMTYPVPNIQGAIVSGFMTPYFAQDFYYPEDVLAGIEKAIGRKYLIYPADTIDARRPARYFDACHRLLDMRTATFSHLIDSVDWDFFMGVFFDTDRILHQAWHLLEPDHPMRGRNSKGDQSQLVLAYFDHLDASIGQLVEQAGPDTNVVIMSDHGMGAVHRMITLNTWLLRQKLIRLKRNPYSGLKHSLFRLGFTLRNSHRLIDRLHLAKHAEYKLLYSADRLLKKIFLSFSDVDWSNTPVYSVGRDIGPLFINLKGREPGGIVEPGQQYEDLRQELAENMRTMTDPVSGKQLVGKVLFKEDVYHGPFLPIAPDLIVEPAEEVDIFYGLSDFGSNRVYEPFYRYSGMHRRFGMLVMQGPDFKPAVQLEGARIIDVAPSVLHAMGLAIPEDMDGRPLTDAFAKKKVVKLAPVDGQSKGDDINQESGYGQQDALDLEDRLRKLGYLG